MIYNFRKTLKIAEEQDIMPWRLIVASEVDCLDLELTDEQFESVCDFVYDWTTHSQASPNEVAQYLKDGLDEEEFTLNDIMNWDNKVSDYINHCF